MPEDNLEASLKSPDLRRVYSYWRSKCVGDQLPSRADIDPADLPDLLPRIYLVDVIRNEDGEQLDFRYRLAGTEHFDINQMELTGRSIAEAFAADRVEGIRASYAGVVVSRQPLLTSSVRRPVRPPEGHVVYDRLLLPLATDGATIGY